MAMNDAMLEEAKTKVMQALSKLEISKLLFQERDGKGCTDLIKELNNYIENTPEKQRENDWNELKPYSNPDSNKFKVEGYQSDDGKMEHQIAIETVNALYHKKPAEWSEEDEEMFDAVIADIQFTQKTHNHEVNQVVYEREIDWLKSIKDRIQHQSKQEWSEYDKIQLSEAIQMIEANGTWIRSEDAVKKVSNWLKSIKPNHWKPSGQQIKALKGLLDYNIGVYDYNQFQIVDSLYSDLQKL
jgi:hypothetical protein